MCKSHEFEDVNKAIAHLKETQEKAVRMEAYETEHDELIRLRALTEQKYARDCLEPMTLGEIISKLRGADSDDAFLDVLDREFLFGAWGSFLTDPASRVPRDFMRDIRGLVLNIARPKSK